MLRPRARAASGITPVRDRSWANWLDPIPRRLEQSHAGCSVNPTWAGRQRPEHLVPVHPVCSSRRCCSGFLSIKCLLGNRPATKAPRTRTGSKQLLARAQRADLRLSGYSTSLAVAVAFPREGHAGAPARRSVLPEAQRRHPARKSSGRCAAVQL